MCQMHPNSDVQLWNWFLTTNSDSTHQKWMKFAFIDTCSIFLQSYWVSDNMIYVDAAAQSHNITISIFFSTLSVSFSMRIPEVAVKNWKWSSRKTNQTFSLHWKLSINIPKWSFIFKTLLNNLPSKGIILYCTDLA